MKQKIFITGGTGCIGHYVIEEALTTFHEAELHLLCRDSTRLRKDLKDHPSIHCHKGSMETIEDLKPILQTMEALIHIATPWGDEEETVNINVNQAIMIFIKLNYFNFFIFKFITI